MRQIHVNESDLLSTAELKELTGHVLLTEQRKQLVRYESGAYDVEIFKPDGSLLARLLKNVLPERVCNGTYELLRTVKGSPANRPGILDKKARIPERRNDGKLSGRMGARALIKKLRREGFQIGNADMLGPYRGRDQRTHQFVCARTAWTLRKPELYGGVLNFVHEVNAAYQKHAPAEYERQLQYVNTIPARWKIKGTAFTTVYVIKDNPTALHVDEFDIPTGFGVMTTLGSFKGGELCFPKYRVAIDYQPTDVILADVHEWHGNFPQLDGERIACVFFCRKDQHKCPA